MQVLGLLQQATAVLAHSLGWNLQGSQAHARSCSQVQLHAQQRLLLGRLCAGLVCGPGLRGILPARDRVKLLFMWKRWCCSIHHSAWGRNLGFVFSTSNSIPSAQSCGFALQRRT